ncbi:Metalloproteases (Zincins), catalytic [Venustampulla echinocandica]|uniref:Disintegrin and metalloproteinase domain-containing protein B n=1 Tax=Venustampulla echinocandica TaxID=2656787 RepID=A0A370TXT6_9HELO|nr:Metalloproteases (Zincins), catalytic [Venustampulla echinocandica]RDL40320.1 Metalloproteases (Zincins), catalytic [Venustampulla echinocandica]
MRLLRSIATVIVSTLCLSGADAHSTQRNPIRYLSPVDNAAFRTPSNRVNALSDFSVTFDLHGGKRRVKLVLTPNHDVISDSATISYLAPDGSVKHAEPVDRLEYRVFKGKTVVQRYEGAEWENVGWARILVHRDGKHPLFEGAFRVDGDHHHIQTTTHYMQTKHELDPIPEHTDGEHMVVWRDSDVMSGISGDSEGRFHGELKRSLSGESSCSADKLSFNTQLDHPVYRAMVKREDTFWGSASTRSIFGRQIDGQTFGNSAGVNLASTIGQTTGCPSTRKVALVGIATDCTYTAAFNSSATARANIILALNTASTQYEDSFNITLGLQNLTISDAACPATAQPAAPWNVGCSDSVKIQDRLNLFSAWRGQRPDNNAYWTLLSTCATGSAVGLAWLGQACVNTAQSPTASGNNETVTGANVVVRTSTEWQVIAHETGHTFGAVHDCTSQSCADGQTVASQQCCPLSATTCDAAGAFIMNPSTGANIQKFSPCTIGNICAGFARNSVKTNCLLANKDVTIITASQCGNGIVESGEDCDCGGPNGCGSNPCCDPATCKFKNSAVCDPSNEDCCTTSCQFAGSGTVCRASTGVCDPQEVCSGTAATCPPDATAPAGTSCGNSSSLECSSGQCTSRDLQCKSIMGSFTQGNDTYACSPSGCQISCASPEFGANVCYKMQQNFLDGTSCQGGGRCENGNCKGSSVGKEITSWINSNKTLVIALSSVIGGLIVLSILSCCISKCRRRRNIKARQNKPPLPPGWQGPPPVNQWNFPPAVPHASSRRLSSRDPGWGQEPSTGWRPPPPTWQPQPSVRYA